MSLAGKKAQNFISLKEQSGLNKNKENTLTFRFEYWTASFPKKASFAITLSITLTLQWSWTIWITFTICLKKNVPSYMILKINFQFIIFTYTIWKCKAIWFAFQTPFTFNSNFAMANSIFIACSINRAFPVAFTVCSKIFFIR